MDIEITWLSLLKIFLAGIFTYVVFPSFLVLRDFLLWKIVDVFILTSTLQARITMYAEDAWYINNKYNKTTTVQKNNGEPCEYYLDGEKINKETYKEYSERRNFHTERAESSNNFIIRKHNLLVWLFKNYKQEKGSNPIPKWQEKARKRVEERESTKNA